LEESSGEVVPLAQPPETPIPAQSSFEEFIQAETLQLGRQDLAFKQREASLSRFFNPLLVAIIGAILVGIVNIYVSHLSAKSSEAIAQANVKSSESIAQNARESATQQEIMMAENTNILEVIKLGEPEKVRGGLCLLIKLNAIKTADTNLAVRAYLKEHNGCDEPKPPEAQWLTANATVPGCGTSGCYQATSVCGSIPSGMKPTGSTRNFIDSFSGAWGDWEGAPSFGSDKVCRVFNQHSHNVTRAVSFQYEVVPNK
jgi:hypothetical protein